MSERKDVKETAFSTLQEQEQRATCTHEWEPVYMKVFGYIPVDEQCLKCRTYRSREAEVRPSRRINPVFEAMNKKDVP